MAERKKKSLSHLDREGKAKMVDVGEKKVTRREAEAEALVHMSPETMELVVSGDAPKGDVLSTARVAGIAAAKRTHELIPLCHPLSLDSVSVELEVDDENSVVRVVALARATERTGVEMEALVAAAVGALTVYDMLKAAERGIEIGPVRLISKSGGESGTFRRDD